jgi:hypothetical protein
MGGRMWPDPNPATPLPKGQHGRKPKMPTSNQHGHKPSAPKVSTSGHGRKPPPPRPDSDNCCPMAAAVRSVRRGRYRLARRYAVMSVRLIAARLT